MDLDARATPSTGDHRLVNALSLQQKGPVRRVVQIQVLIWDGSHVIALQGFDSFQRSAAIWPLSKERSGTCGERDAIEIGLSLFGR